MEQPPDTFRSPSRPATTGIHRRRRPLLAVAVLGTVLVSGAAGALLVTAGGGGSDARLTAAADRSSAAPSSPEDAGAGTTPVDPSPTAPPPSTAPADPPTSAPAGRTTRAARDRVTTTPPRTTKRTTKRTTTRTTTRTRTRTTPPRTTTTTKTSSAAPSGSLAQQVLALTNAERTAAGCKPLAWDATLAKVAQAHSEDMRDNNFFAHESQDGRSPFDRMKNAGYSFRTAAENIAAGQPTPKSVMESWMNSAGHRANILNCSLTELGVGVAKGGSYGIYWTQDFGTPA